MSIMNEIGKTLKLPEDKKEKTITIPLWEYKFLNQLKEELIIDMKIEELKKEENYKKAMDLPYKTIIS